MMRATPINDMNNANVAIRPDGRALINMYLMEVKMPAASHEQIRRLQACRHPHRRRGIPAHVGRWLRIWRPERLGTARRIRTGHAARYDVIVAGGGNAALCAAIAARREGSSVLVLEAAPKFYRGGNHPAHPQHALRP